MDTYPRKLALILITLAAGVLVAAPSHAERVHLIAVLNGPQVPTSSTGQGVGKFEVDTTKNTLTYDISFAGLSAAETSAHIHGPAAAGMNAGILHPLSAGPRKTGVWNYLESQEADIISGSTYVNIHSSAFPSGEIRGQIVSMVSLLDGPAAGTSSSATGTGLFVIDTDLNTLTYYIFYSGLSGSEFAAHIHGFAPHGTPANVVHPLPAGSPKVGVWNYSEDQEASILDGLTYVNVHTSFANVGEIRGQVTSNVTFIDGLQAGTGATGYGVGDFSIDTSGNELGYHITYTGLTGPETASHIHGSAARGEPAGILHTLPDGTPKVGSWLYNEVDESNILAGLTYVNIHTSANPAGEIRGQIEPVVTLFPTAVLGWSTYR